MNRLGTWEAESTSSGVERAWWRERGPSVWRGPQCARGAQRLWFAALVASHLSASSVPTVPVSLPLRWAPGAPARLAPSPLSFIRLPPARSESGFPFSWTRFLTWALWRGSARRAFRQGSGRRSWVAGLPTSRQGTKAPSWSLSPFGQALVCLFSPAATDPVGDGLFKEGKSPGWGPLSPAVQKGELASGLGGCWGRGARTMIGVGTLPRRRGNTTTRTGVELMCNALLWETEGPGTIVGRFRSNIHLAIDSCIFPVPGLHLQVRPDGKDTDPWPLSSPNGFPAVGPGLRGLASFPCWEQERQAMALPAWRLR